MRVFDPSKRVVNPVLLAQQTGITTMKRVNAPHGFIYTNSVGLNGMGSAVGDMSNFDPEPISSAALGIIDKITQLFGLGAGRREADIIVPIQNNVVSSVIAPISAAVNDPAAHTLSYQSLQKMWDAITATEAKWLAFLHNTDWKDGRAAQQAEATLQPYFKDQENKIQALMQTASTSIIQSVTGAPDVPGLVTPNIPGSSGPSGIPFGPAVPSGVSVLTAGASSFVPLLLGVGLLWYFGHKWKGLH